MGGKSVLVVDDSRLSRSMIREIILHHFPDWSVIEAESADQALASVEGRDFDYMTIDINMPGKDGITLGSELRRRFPAARLSVITANVQQAIRDRAEQAGLGFVAKPISETKILEFLRGGAA